MRQFLGIILLLILGYCVFLSMPGYTLPVHANGSYRDVAVAYAQEAGIPASLFVRQINQESGFDPGAHGAAGEVGIAQFMPETARGLGIDPADPVQALKAAAQLMGRYYHQFGDYAKALGAYNCGVGCVQQAIARGGWYWQTYIPASTRQYINAIMS